MMLTQINENMYEYYDAYMKIILLFCTVFIVISFSRCFAQEFESETIMELEDTGIAEPKVNETERNEEEAIQEGEEARMEDLDKTKSELIQDDYHYDPLGKRDPFYSRLLEEKKKIEPNKQLFGVQRYDLAELKLVGIIWGGLGRKGVVETPEGKSYLLKVGSLVGKNGGVVKAITNQEIVIQEFVTDYLGNNIENISVIKIQHKEQEQ
ncbi:MAG: pilus assembly protein PilP [bacterium]